MFDHIVIGIGVNTAKAPWMPVDQRIEHIQRVYATEPKVSVASFSGLAADFARDCGAECLLRGVRSVADFEYERNMADANRMITSAGNCGAPLETVFIPALPELGAVSSSLVRELARFGAPYKQFLP